MLNAESLSLLVNVSQVVLPVLVVMGAGVWLERWTRR